MKATLTVPVILRCLALVVLITFFATSSALGADEDSYYYTIPSYGKDPVPDVSLFTGAATYQVPIQIPPGRNGMQPDLRLAYNSYKGNGWIGVGWDIEIGAIIRSSKNGLDYAANEFEVNGPMATGVLVPRNDLDTGCYGLRTEGQFTQFKNTSPNSAGWEVLTRDGLKYYYGTTTGSRQYSGANVYKWCLDKIEDTHGNTVVIRYIKNSGAIYPLDIRYQESGSAYYNRIEFELSSTDRPDATLKYDTQFAVRMNKRLEQINIYQDGELISYYTLDYGTGTNSNRSRLTAVQQFGVSGTSHTSQPAYSFEYQEGGAVTYTNHGATTVVSGEKFFNDFNGDGLSDLICITDNTVYPYLSDGNGLFDEINTTALPIADKKYKILDWRNNDGIKELVIYEVKQDNVNNFKFTVKIDVYDIDYIDTPTTPQRLVFNNHTEISGTITLQTDVCDSCDNVLPYLENYSYSFREINNDGFMDFIFTSRDRYQDSRNDDDVLYARTRVYLYRCNPDSGTLSLSNLHTDYNQNTHGPAFPKVTIGTVVPGYTKVIFNTTAFIEDINGDGFGDLISGNYDEAGISLYNGAGGFEYIGSLNIYDHYGGETIVDLNGDGLNDYFQTRVSNDIIQAFLSNGDGTFTKALPEEGEILSRGNYDNFADVNGDGLLDIITTTDGSTSVTTYLSNGGGKADLLVKARNGKGAETLIDYKDTTYITGTYLPFNPQPVRSITIKNGFQSSSLYTYTYSGGAYSPEDKDFLGFETVTQTNPDGTLTATTYLQDQFRKGRPSVITHTSGETLLSKTTYTWHPVDTAQAWQFVRLDKKLSEQWNSNTKVWSRQTYQAYNEESGFPTSLLIEGTGATDITKYWTYANQDSNGWCWRLTQEGTQYWVSSTITNKDVRKTTYTYYQTNSDDGGIGDLQYRYDYIDGATELKTTYKYDGYGNITTITDPKGYATDISYDVDTHTYPETITNAAGHTIQKTWDYRFGKAATVTDANQNDTLYTYDVFGRLKTTTRKEGTATIAYIQNNYADSAFQNNGTPNYIVNFVKESSGVYIESRQYYDGLGRVIQSVTEGEGIDVYIVTKTYFDNMGRIQYQAGPFKRTADTYIAWNENAFANTNYPLTKNIYDDMGRVVETETSDNDSLYSGAITPISTAYYYNGAVTEIIDPDQNMIKQTRDHLGRITNVIEYLEKDVGEIAYTTQYSYNGAGDLTKVTDAAGKSTTITYDWLGRKLTMNDPDMGAWSYDYDANGNLISQTDAKGQETQFIYDEINRLTDKTYINTDPGVVTQDAAYTYDNAGANGIGRLYQMSNSDVTITYDDYDALGRVKKRTKTITGDIARVTQYSYDLAGRLKNLTYPDNTSVSYAYHAGTALLNTVSDSSTTYAAAVNYHPTGKMGTLTFGNSVNTTYTYDSKSARMTRLLTKKGANTLMDRNYRYSSAGDIRQITDEDGITHTYHYDSLHRLVAEETDPPILAATPAILSFEHGSGAPHHAPYSVQVNGGAPYIYQYDFNGNMDSAPDVSDPDNVSIREVTFNAENMPVTIKRDTGAVPQLLATYLYDGEGSRAKKTANGKTTYYINDYCEVINGQLVKYIFAGNLRIAKVQGGAVTYFHKDHLGSSTLMTDAGGNVLESTAYLPYGGQRGVEAISGTGYRFTDQEFDGETGLYNYDARLYDPVVGVFVSADTITPGGGFDPQMLNRFAYVRNNPLRYVDPGGHSYGSWEPGGETDFGEQNDDFEKHTKEWDDKGKQKKGWEYLYDEKRSATWKIKNHVPYEVKNSYKRNGINGEYTVVQNCIGYDGKLFIKATTVLPDGDPPIVKILSNGRTLANWKSLTMEEQLQTLGVVAGATAVVAGGVIIVTQTYPALLVFAGTPAGQTIINEVIPSMNPGSLPSPTFPGGAIGWSIGVTIEHYLTNNQ